MPGACSRHEISTWVRTHQEQEAGGVWPICAEIRGMNDYERVARIIRHLDDHHVEQPGLEELAAHLGLSRFHFHRLFSRWAGVTPKDFLQCLTLEHARERLRQGESVFDAALDVGLSSPGRLHDLCVTLEAATPGEIKGGGEGWTIEAGLAATPFGLCCIGNGPRGVCHLAFVESAERTTVSEAILALWPKAELRWNNVTARRIAAEVFQPGGETHLRALVRGTPFQLRVWRALLRIPPGGMVSYGHLATAIGHQGAARAVGTAVGTNPLAYLIPCHRVIRETGVIGQYRWGHERKRALLAWEAMNG
ncbi:methylated-DNA--[protein]-cysteine S-methyltransferase [Prosthecobacter sp.]|uniref:bifunctional transcriptional activator/DNA repair enzyme AdaA n=1 Tax=Prosthecobacter sp. TaxID=1965333 RepID=UPI002ABB6899|nr:methylated-DNA--[protein]-cysteine S-methyltransferase [Prosthecobacter sp.]MDZ4405380.1 methylated-DNA--[protein]-cysteine S-methyltransferase [Prosthecobacter sp.]